MRAEAALMVEMIEDEANAAVQKVLKKSQSTQQAALKGLIEITKAKDREERLRKRLSSAQETIKEKTVEIRYLTELLQSVSSTESPENGENLSP